MRSGHRVLAVLPPLLWMGLIALGSSNLLAGDRTGRWLITLLGQLAPGASPTALAALHAGLRKLGHVVEYGILAVLWHRALWPSPQAARAAFLVAAAYGGLDEIWQGFHPSRTPAVKDVLIDAGGALLGVAAWTGAGPWRPVLLRIAAWSVALLAGLTGLAAAVDVALGRPAGALGAAALGLGLVAAGLARLARAPRGPWRAPG